MRVISEKDTWEAGDIKVGEGVPSVKEPVDGRLDLWTKEEGVSDILFFFFSDWSKLQIHRTAKRNRPTKDKRQETRDKTKTAL